MSDEKVVHDRRNNDIPVWEKHGQSILAACILGMLVWLVATVNENEKHAIEYKGQLELANHKIDSLTLQIDRMLSNSPTKQDMNHMQSQIDSLRDRLGNAEAILYRKVKKMEEGE